jgi:site-specific DNA recombinase
MSAYPGEHSPIVDEDLWLKVQQKLEANGVERQTTRAEAAQAYLLAGILFDAGGEPMTPTHAIKKGLRYRYYVSRRLITGVRAERERDQEAGQRLPAAQLERLIVERLRTFFADSDAVTEALPPRRRDAPSVKRALAAAADVVRAIEAGGEDRSSAILRSLIARVQVHSDRIDVDLWAELVGQALLTGGHSFCDQADGPIEVAHEGSGRCVLGRLIRLTIEAALKRAGVEMKFVFDRADEASTPDVSLVRLLTRAHGYQAQRNATCFAPRSDTARQSSLPLSRWSPIGGVAPGGETNGGGRTGARGACARRSSRLAS